MSTSEETEARPKAPPIMSPVTLYNFVETHRRTLPSRIDRSLMKSVAGSDQARILAALEFLDLIDSQGRPTKRFERLRDVDTEDQVIELWAEIVMDAYPQLFIGFNLDSATQGQIDEKFREVYYIQGDTVRKAVAFFLSLARNARIPLSPYVKQTRKRAPRGSSPAAKRPGPSKNRKKTVETTDDEAGSAQEISGVARATQSTRLHPAVQAWIDEMPGSGEEWERSDFENWLAIFRASVERAYKIAPKVS